MEDLMPALLGDRSATGETMPFAFVLRISAISLLTAIVACGPAGGDDAPAPALASWSVDITDAGTSNLAIRGVAPARPVVTTDERRHLVYELFFQNLDAVANFQIAKIDVLAGRRQVPVASYEGPSLGVILQVIGGDAANGVVPPGGMAVAFLDIAWPTERRLTEDFGHRITIVRENVTSIIAGPTVVVDSEEPRRIGPPLRGDNLLDIVGCCRGGHTRALYAFEGDLFLAQRYAADFVRVIDEQTFAGDPAQNESYFLFGADVVAVGSGVVVDARDGIPENVPTQPLPPFDVERATGNFVVEALGDNQFALYAHLQTGSVRVQPGDRVRRGQIIGRAGNTGNSSQPHLHFHVMAGPAPLASDGLPFVFDRFRFDATIDLTSPSPVIVPVPPPQQRRNRLPMTGDFISFPGEGPP
jgi:hypothetical protein